MTQNDDNAGVRFPPPLVYFGCLLIGLALDRVAGLPPLGLPASLRPWLAAAALAPALALIVAALNGFRQARTPPEPWRTTTAFVSHGVYRFTRNPMYLGMAAIHLAVALLGDSLGALIMLPLAIVAIQTQVIAREEAYLLRRFGDEYETYRRRVRRWL